MKILIVDDDTVVLDSCKRVLEAEGFEVHLASGAKEALAAIKSGSFGLLFIDVKMPEHDGMWLIKKLKEERAEIPIVIMSGYPIPETIDDGLKLGVANFIAKPFTPDELMCSVQQALKKEQGDGNDQGSGN